MPMDDRTRKPASSASSIRAARCGPRRSRMNSNQSIRGMSPVVLVLIAVLALGGGALAVKAFGSTPEPAVKTDTSGTPTPQPATPAQTPQPQQPSQPQTMAPDPNRVCAQDPTLPQPVT